MRRVFFVFFAFLVFNVSSVFNVNKASAQVNTDVMTSIGKNALYFHDYALSIQYFSTVTKAKPYLFEPFFFRGLAKFYLEDYLGAEQDFNRVVSLNPYFTDTYQLRGLSRIHNAEYVDAIADFRKAIAFDPGMEKGFRHNISYCFIKLDSLNDAEHEVDTILSRWPDYTDALHLKAEIRIREERWDEALGIIDSILQRKPQSINTWNLKANLLLYRQNYEEAVKALTTSLEMQPLDVRNLISRAICYHYLDNLRGQMDDYNAIIDLDPSNFFAHYNRGQLRAFVGEDNLAIEDFNYIIANDSDDIMSIYNRGLLLDRTGDYTGAIRDYTTVINHFPKFLQGYHLRAEARKKAGDYRGAMKDEEHLLKEEVAHRYGYSTPTSSSANRTMRHRDEINLDDYQQLVADEDVTDSIHESMLEPDAFASGIRGRIQNKKVEAKLLEEILYNGEMDPAAVKYYNDGCKAAMAANPDAAMTCFTMAIETQPDFGEAYYNRGLLHIFKDEIKTGLADLSLAGQFGIYGAYSIIKQYNNTK